MIKSVKENSRPDVEAKHPPFDPSLALTILMRRDIKERSGKTDTSKSTAAITDDGSDDNSPGDEIGDGTSIYNH